jgi:hypothetical protein
MAAKGEGKALRSAPTAKQSTVNRGMRPAARAIQTVIVLTVGNLLMVMGQPSLLVLI